MMTLKFYVPWEEKDEGFNGSFFEFINFFFDLVTFAFGLF